MSLFKKIFTLPIRGYQLFISPLLGNNCRYVPSCSQYMIIAIEEWGILKGFYLGIMRIGRCHPFSKSHGPDPVPKNEKRNESTSTKE